VGAVLSPLLDVDTISVRGIDDAHIAEVRSALAGDIGKPLLLLDTGAAAARIEALPWVDHAQVSRQLPGTLSVEVTPRFAVGWRTDAHRGVVLVDAHGAVISAAATAPAGLPQLGGSAGDLRAASRVAAALSAALRAEVVGVAVDHGSAALQLATGAVVRFGQLDQLHAKVRAADAMLRALAGTPFGYLDVSVPSAPVTGTSG